MSDQWTSVAPSIITTAGTIVVAYLSHMGVKWAKRHDSRQAEADQLTMATDYIHTLREQIFELGETPRQWPKGLRP